MINSKAVGIQVPWDSITPSAGYMGWWPCTQATGNMIDRSGLNNDGTPAAAGILWDNVGWASFQTIAADQAVSIPTEVLDFDFANGESMILSFWMDKVDEIRYHMPIHTANVNGEIGFKMQAIDASVDGRYMLAFYSGGTVLNLSRTTENLADGAPHHIVIALDAATETLDVYVDSALDGTLANVDIGAWKTQGTPTGTVANNPLAIGGPSNAVSEMKIRDIHALKRTGGLPSDIQQVVNRLHSRPFYPLSNDDWSVS